MSIDIGKQHRSPGLDPHEIRSSTQFRAQLAWSSRPPVGGRLHVAACERYCSNTSRHVRWSGTGGGWGCSDTGRGESSDTGRSARSKDFELQGKMRCVGMVSRIVPRHGLLRNFENELPQLSRPPTPPPPSTHSSCAVAWHRNGAAQWGRHPPHHHRPSQCRAGPEALHRMGWHGYASAIPVPVPSTVAWLEWCRLRPPPTPPPTFTVLGGARCMSWRHQGAQPCIHMRKASPRQKNQLVMTYRII